MLFSRVFQTPLHARIRARIRALIRALIRAFFRSRHPAAGTGPRSLLELWPEQLMNGADTLLDMRVFGASSKFLEVQWLTVFGKFCRSRGMLQVAMSLAQIEGPLHLVTPAPS